MANAGVLEGILARSWFLSQCEDVARGWRELEAAAARPDSGLALGMTGLIKARR